MTASRISFWSASTISCRNIFGEIWIYSQATNDKGACLPDTATGKWGSSGELPHFPHTIAQCSTSLLVRYLQVVSTEVHVPVGTRRPLNVLSHWIELDRVIKRGSWRFIVEDIKHFLVCVVSELCIQRFACLP